MITPLSGGTAYFAMMAARAGALSSECEFITTCYLPRQLNLSGGLVLPEKIDDVIACEIEKRCLEFSNEVWVTHSRAIDEIAKAYGLAGYGHFKSVKAASASKPQASKPPKHIIFAGDPTPLYGFDAFCETAEALGSEFTDVTVMLPPHQAGSRIASAARKTLSAHSFTLNWIESDDYTGELSKCAPGIVIAPMRAPVFPRGASAAQDLGLPVIWGGGFDLPHSAVQAEGIIPVPSDTRKIQTACLKLWGTDTCVQRDTPKTLPTAKVKPAAKPELRAPIKNISIILIHHNRLTYIRDALASLAGQTHKDFELIIVDDGSPQDVFKQLETLVKDYDFSDLKLCTIENSYPSAARNHGAMLASGDALFFVDDDNILDPGALRAFRSALNQHDIALSFFQTFQDTDSPKFTPSPEGVAQFGPGFCFAGLLPGSSLFYNVIGNSSMMIRKDVFMSLGGFSGKYGVGLEDYAFLAKAALRGGISDVVIPEPYLHFRLHADKIRNTHVDWRSTTRLQAGLWRLLSDMGGEHGGIPPIAMGYARQLHEITSLQYVTQKRPKYFSLKFILVHQYVRRFLSQFTGLRRAVVKFTAGESRLAKFLEKLFF